MSAPFDIRNSTLDIPTVLQRTLTQYRRQQLTRAGVLEALGLGCVLLLLARLHGLGVGLRELAGVGLTGFLLLAFGAWWTAWQARRMHTASLLTLDRKLGLNGRLLTALEFAHDPQPPVLYPFLVQDTVQALPRSMKQTSRVLDRRTLALAVVLLALLVWPWQRTRPTQLASSKPFAAPPLSEPPQPPPTSPPEQPPSSRDQQQRSQGAGQQASGSGNSQPQAGAHGASQSSSSTSSPQPSQGQPSQTSGSDTSGQQGASSSSHPRDSSKAGQTGNQAGTPQDGSQGSRTDGHGSQQSSPQGPSTKPSSPSSGTSTSHEQPR
ncbi:MAG: hypothetical protein HYZ89_06760, partial [Candidatus Omnitrophica bacterium]|nr:hypothetical protein [Candidatus Omnitrophota bacterium]